MASRRKRLLLLLLPLLLIAGPAAWIASLFQQARTTLQDHARQSRAYLGTFPSEFSERPAIFDPPEPGDAWGLELLAACKITRTTVDPKDVPMVNRTVTFRDGTFRARARSYDVTEPNLDLLRSALRRRSTTPAQRPGYGLNSIVDDALMEIRRSIEELHSRGRDYDAFERLILALGLAQDLARHGDITHRSTLWVTEMGAALDAKEILEEHALSTRELQSIALWLDRLDAGRPSMARTMALENALERVAVCDPAYRLLNTYSPIQWITFPTWRELWSSLIHDAKRVTTLARAQAALDGMETLPPWERGAAAAKKLSAMDLAICPPREIPQPLHYQYDARSLRWRAMLRLAVALAWHERERGALPATLDGLVPQYLPALPPCPFTGEPFLLERGRLRFHPLREKPVSEDELELLGDRSIWKIGRRKQ